MASASFGGFGVSFSLRDEFSGVANSIKQSFAGLDNATGSLVDKVQNGMSQIAAGAAVAGIGLAALAPIYLAIEKASDLQESMTKNNTVFGDSVKYVNDFVKESAVSFGLSDNAAYAAIGTYGNLFTALGLGQKQAADYSVNLTKLGADLASFNNTDIQTALDALRSGLAGETEPLKKFGVALNEGLIKAKAFQMGLTTGIKVDLTPVQKMQAAYELILEQTKTAQGDFIRTGDGYANMTRKIGARVENLSVRLGSIFLPLVEKVAMLFEKTTTYLTAFADTTGGKVVLAIAALSLALFGLILVGKGTQMMFGGVMSAAWAAFAPFLPIIGIIAAVIGALALLTGGFDNLWTVVQGLSAVFMSASSEGFSMSQELAAALDSIGLLDFVVAMGTWFVRIKEFFGGVVDGFIDVYNVVAYVFGIIWDIVSAVFSAIGTVLEYFGITISNNTSSLESWATAGKLVAYVLGAIMVVALISLLAPLYSVAVAFVAAFWFPMLIILIIVGVLWLLWQVVSFLWESVLKPFGEWLWSYLGPAFTMIGNVLGFIWDALKWVADIVWQAIQPAFEAMGSVMMWLYENGIKPLIDGFSWLFGGIADGVSWAWEKISGFFSGIFDFAKGMWDAGANIVNGLWEGIKSAWDSFTSWISDAWNNSMVGKAVNWLIDGTVQVAGDIADVATGEANFDSIKAKYEGQIQNGLSQLAGTNGQQQAGVDPIVNNTNTETVKSITVVSQLDGEKISQSIIDKQQFDSARH